MPTNVMTSSKKSLSSYAELRRRVRETIAAGKERALEAVERESVQTKWEVGKLVLEHILLNQSRADYGARVIDRLSKDLAMDSSELRRMVEFTREYPKFGPGRKLSWAHHKMLLGINDKAKRDEITRKAEAGDWSKRDLRQEINKQQAAKQITVLEAPAEEPLVPVKGKLDTYRIITAKAGPWTGQTALDLGFANYLSLEIFSRRWPQEPFSPASRREGRRGVAAFRDRDIVETVRAGIQKSKRTEGDLFTYRAYLLQVTDADTLWVLIDLGFGFVTQQQLRLRGIDAPEITSRAGLEAKQFVERELKKATRLIITSTKSDKYDRYLADVFYTVNGKERFLTNRLLEAGLAQKVAA